MNERKIIGVYSTNEDLTADNSKHECNLNNRALMQHGEDGMTLERSVQVGDVYRCATCWKYWQYKLVKHVGHGYAPASRRWVRISGLSKAARKARKLGKKQRDVFNFWYVEPPLPRIPTGPGAASGISPNKDGSR